MTIVVTGAAGFIGSNFVLNWLTHSEEKVIALDKLTYAGNLENLKSVEANANYEFAQGDIGDSGVVAKLLHQHQPRVIIILRQKVMWIDRFTAPMILCKLIFWEPIVC